MKKLARTRAVIDHVYDGGKSARIRELTAETDRLRAAIVASDAGMQTLREQHARACDERDRALEMLRALVVEVDFVISGGDDPHEACTECGLTGIGMMRDARKNAVELLKGVAGG